MTVRRSVAVLLAAVAMTACAADDPGDTSAGPEGSSTTTTIAGDPDGTGTVPGGGPAATSPGGGTAPGGGPPETTPGDPVTTIPAATPDPGPVGAFARFFLATSESASLVVEVLVQAGAEPASGTVDHVVGAIDDVADKAVSISRAAIPGGAREWTASSLIEAAEAAGGAQSRDAARLRLLFVRGSLEGDDGVLGVAVRSDVAAVFVDKIASSGGVLGDSTAAEKAVTLHEVGHILGLVDLVLETGRADPEHPGHSPNRESVMYWAVESTLVGQVLGEHPPVDFDAADRADLIRIRDSR